MFRTEAGGSGPFAYYPTSGDAIRDTADEIGERADGIGAVRRQLDQQHRQLVGAVAGDLRGSMVDAPTAIRADMDRVAQAAQFAAGVLRMFADAVDEYNHGSTNPRSVARLNLAYTEARLDHFGLDAAEYEPGGAMADDSETDWRQADAALLRSLTVEYHRLGEQLDIWADHAARMLDRGPNPDDLRELWASGVLPSDAYETWPALLEVPLLRLPYDLRSGPDDTRGLCDLSQDELLELADDGFEPAEELLGDQVAHDFENMTALREFNLHINPLYWKALSEGLPERVARLIADANPHSFVEILTPYVMVGMVVYDFTARDLVDALRDDPLSLRTLAELAMVTPVGRVGNVRKLDDVVDAIDDGRDAERLEDGVAAAKEGGSAIEDAAKAARVAADRADTFIAKVKHQPGSPGTYNKFAHGVDIRAAVKDALTSPEGRFIANSLPDTFRVVTDVGYVVGSRGETSLRVIVSGDGRIINAFPVKVK